MSRGLLAPACVSVACGVTRKQCKLIERLICPRTWNVVTSVKKDSKVKGKYVFFSVFAVYAEKMAARKPNPATNGLGSDGVDGLQRWGDVPPTAVEADLSEVFLLEDMVTSAFVMNEELHILSW